MDRVEERIGYVRADIEAAARASGRDPGEVLLIAVAKGVSADTLARAAKAGVTTFGENKVQEAMVHFDALKHLDMALDWHMIGHLQTNKVKQAISLFSTLHSLDSLKLAREMHRRCVAQDRTVKALVQVNIGHESTKWGIHPDGLESFLREATQFHTLFVCGIMIIPPCENDPEAARPWFAAARGLFERAKKLRLSNVQLRHLSMGMSGDYKVAVEEGATMVRIGTAIFGPRPQ